MVQDKGIFIRHNSDDARDTQTGVADVNLTKEAINKGHHPHIKDACSHLACGNAILKRGGAFSQLHCVKEGSQCTKFLFVSIQVGSLTVRLH